MKPISAKQFLMFGLCFFVFVIVQGIVLQKTLVEYHVQEVAKLKEQYNSQASEIEDRLKLKCNDQEDQAEVIREMRRQQGQPQVIPADLQENIERCKEAKSLREQAFKAGRADRLEAETAAGVLKTVGLCGGLIGFVMFGIAALKSWRTRKQAASAAA